MANTSKLDVSSLVDEETIMDANRYRFEIQKEYEQYLALCRLQWVKPYSFEDYKARCDESIDRQLKTLGEK